MAENSKPTAPWERDINPEDPGYEKARETTLGFYARIYAEEASELCRTFGALGKETLRDSLTRYAVRRLETFGPASGVLAETRRGCFLRAWWNSYGYEEEADIYCSTVCPRLHPAAAAKNLITRDQDSCILHSLSPVSEEYKSPMARFQCAQDALCLLVYFLVYDLIEVFGLEGDAAARRALRRYAHDRGVLMRAAHEAEGLPINLVTLFHNQDLPTDPRFQRNETRCDPEVRFNENYRCPFNDVWAAQKDGGRIGRIYCEEVHIPLWTGWHPQTQVHLSQTLTQGDDRCRFSVYLRPSNSLPEPEWRKGRKPNI